MAEDRNYTLTIVNETTDTNSPIAGDSKDSDTLKGKGFLTKEQAKTYGKAMVAYSKAKTVTLQVINHEISLVSLKTGQNEMQQKLQFNMELAQQGLSIIESIVTGAAVGGWVGAIVGAVASIGAQAFNVYQKQDTINTNKNLENVSIGLNYVRSGASGSRKV